MLSSGVPTFALGLLIFLSRLTTAIPLADAVAAAVPGAEAEVEAGTGFTGWNDLGFGPVPAPMRWCPSPFTIYLGKGNDPQQRDFYLNQSSAMGSTIYGNPWNGRAYVLRDNRNIELAEGEHDKELGLGHAMYLLPENDTLVTLNLKKAQSRRWVDRIVPVKVTMREDCTLRFFSGKRSHLSVDEDFVFRITEFPTEDGIQLGLNATAHL